MKFLSVFLILLATFLLMEKASAYVRRIVVYNCTKQTVTVVTENSYERYSPQISPQTQPPAPPSSLAHQEISCIGDDFSQRQCTIKLTTLPVTYSTPRQTVDKIKEIILKNLPANILNYCVTLDSSGTFSVNTCEGNNGYQCWKT